MTMSDSKDGTAVLAEQLLDLGVENALVMDGFDGCVIRKKSSSNSWMRVVIPTKVRWSTKNSINWAAGTATKHRDF
jgi:hypothetical protein